MSKRSAKSSKALSRCVKENAAGNETREHILTVAKFLHLFIANLLARADGHDQSKLVEPELAYFASVTGNLEGCVYGSKSYKANLAFIKPALDHHYARNRHHPEHHLHGLDDMTLVDLVELFCDWKASAKRHNAGNLLKTIGHNARRFRMSAQLSQILRNTAKELDI